MPTEATIARTDINDFATDGRPFMPEPSRMRISRTGLAALLVAMMKQLSAVRAAYYASIALLAERERDRKALEGRYHRLLEEHRALRRSTL